MTLSGLPTYNTRRDQRLTDDEVRLLLVHLLWMPGLATVAELIRICQDCFIRSIEAGHAMLLGIVIQLRQQYGDSQVTMPMIEAELQRHFVGEDSVNPSGEFWGLYGEQNLLAWIQSFDHASLSEPHGHELLRRFLIERTVVRPLYRQLSPQFGPTDQWMPDLEGLLTIALRQTAQIERHGQPQTQIRAVGAERQEHEQWLQLRRGRQRLGLRTGFQQLDERLSGLRGLTVMAAAPNVGKTAFFLCVGVGICRYHVENDAAVVIVSLDMPRFELHDRLRCHLAQLDFQTLKLGSADCRGRREGPWFTAEHQRQLDQADRLMAEYDLNRRLFICDRSQVGLDLRPPQLASILREAKAAAGARRGVMVIDYLNLVELPEAELRRRRDKLDQDKYRVRFAQEILAATQTPENPEGDTLVVISESRKPANKKESWGSELADILGSGRLPYAVDAALVYRSMTTEDMKRYYGIAAGHGVEERVEQRRQRLEQEGVSPVVLSIAKGRDGMRRGEYPLAFHFRETRFREFYRPPVGERPRPGVRCSAQSG